MPTLRTIIDDSTRREFDSPPIFDTVQRRAFFNLPQWAWRICKSLIEPHNQVMFGLQVGYFRASGRFFEPNKFYDKDIESVCRKLKVKKEEVLSKLYHKNSRYRHIQLILNGFNILPYADQVEEICKKEVTHLVKRQIKLHLVFGSLVNFIRERNFEVPTFSVLAALINEARDEYENHIQIQMGEQLTEELQELLSNFFIQYLPENDSPTRRNSPFRLTKLKTNPELMKVKIIRENMLDFRYLKKSFQQLTPILKRLDFSQNFIEELALQVMRSRTVQVKRLKNRNLYLLCFVQYQYFHLSDILTQTFIIAVEQNINLCEKTYKKRNHDELETNLEKYIPILENYLLEGEIVKSMKDVALGLFHTKEEKLNILATSLANQKTNNFLALIPAVRKLYEQTLRQKQDEGYFEQIEAGSPKLQAKVGDILRYLDFSSNDNLQIAIDFYQKKEGNLSGDIPIGFLKPNERKNVFDKNGKVRLSLYKSLLARHLSKGFKNGTVNKVSNFTNSLTSLKLKNNRSEPDERSFFAAIMAFGCNLGVERMFKTTKNISDFRLETTINNYISSGNLQKANDKVIGIIDRMMIHKLYKKDPSLTHTSSDGQKFDILLDTIHANFSFKYFGKEKGITIYPFLSESHQIFHGLAFSASDREAWYVLDGLMHNEIVESDVHSTDSHGSTDIIFALTYLLGIDFQPRIKQFHMAKLHGMAGMKIEQQMDYIINAGPNINTNNCPGMG